MFIINGLLKKLEDVEKFMDKLEETPVGIRKIFTINEREFTNDAEKRKAQEERNKCYKKMIDMLNKVEGNFVGFSSLVKDSHKEEFKELEKLGPLLRGTWKEYESNLRVHDYSYQKTSHCKQNDDNTWGIYINLEEDKRGTDWVEEYNTIFHEFFHNIYNISNIMHADGEPFGRAIINDVNKLLDEEKKATAKDKTLLREITHETPKKDKAALYDIIGAVFYRGKYGCSPDSNVNPRKSCEYKCVCRCNSYCKSCDYEPYCKPSIRKSKIEKCNSRKETYLHEINSYNCINKGNCTFKNDKEDPFDYKMECSLCTNNWCKKIFGHDDYWGKKTKPPTIEFIRNLAEEAFVHLASEAIVNQKAYEHIIRCLPESYKIFIEMLEKISGQIDLW